MQYHAESLARLEGVDTVTLIGYEGESLHSSILKNTKIKEKR